jgi:ribose transport system ATP-binding protein
MMSIHAAPGESTQTLGDRDSSVALEIAHLSKTFAGGKGIRDVDLTLRRGSAHALLGQNGSGKSTLIKVLAGVYQPDGPTTAEANGKTVQLGSSRDSHEAGIRFIHQDLGLIPSLDVTDNLALGSGYTGSFWLSTGREHRRAQEVLDRFGIEVDASTRVDRLTVAQQTLVAIARALSDGYADGPRVIVLDEPTAALQGAEVAMLFELLDALKRAGNAILYVTHRLTEVFEVCDEVTVLRDGKVVANSAVADIDHDSLVTMIVGDSVAGLEPAAPRSDAPVTLEARAVAGATVTRADVTLHEGEIVGLAGLLGSGYEDLLFLLSGGKKRDGGELSLSGTRIDVRNPQDAIRAGIAFAPADRKRLSSIQQWSLRENITLPRITPSWGGWLSERAEGRDAARWLDRVRVRIADSALLSTLSGGNQQRVVLARWLRVDAKVLLLQEPTSGVDTGAKHDIYLALREAAARGASVFFSSSDTEELAAVADRVIVMRSGVVAEELTGAAMTTDTILRACLGTSESGAIE